MGAAVGGGDCEPELSRQVMQLKPYVAYEPKPIK